METRASSPDLSDFPLPLIGFAAFSGTGKTTLITRLLPLLRARGLRVAVVKHAHHSFDLDHPQKDSYRFREAGADAMVVASRRRCAMIQECRADRDEPNLSEALSMLNPDLLDIVLVEGFKREPIPKIELHRAELGRPLLFPHDPHVIALACDQSSRSGRTGALPCLSIDDPAAIAGFIAAFVGWTPSTGREVAM